jgi:predicted MFS family arabinose efflux permease
MRRFGQHAVLICPSRWLSVREPAVRRAGPGILGFVLVSTFTVSVVLGQAYMPRNPGMASGMIVGFAIGAGGLGATALGGIADRWGLASALWISAVMPLGAFVAALFLPEPRAR